MIQWEATGNRLDDLVIVLDNAPSHAKAALAVIDTPVTILRLGSYSPMLNPCENIWSKVKAEVKGQLRVPGVLPPDVMAQ